MPLRGAALAPRGCLSGAQQPVMTDERKQKNREHALASRIRKKQEFNTLQQDEGRLSAECTLLRAVVHELEQEQKTLKAGVVADLFLC